MRVIGGSARGIQLEAGPSKAVRPTTDRIKESVFNILGSVEDCKVVDIFAGSGSLGLEALSRGAEEIIFIEKDKRTCKTISDNLAKVEKSMGAKSNSKIICGDYKKIFSSNFQPDVILTDPPYSDECALAKELLRSEEFKSWCGEALVVLEYENRCKVLEENSGWKIIRQKDFGTTGFLFLEVEDN